MNHFKRPEVILFEEANHQSGCLKQFLHFISLNKIRSKNQGPPSFSFVDEQGSLIGGLTLRENIALDSIPSTVSSTRTFTLEDHLRRLKNPHLLELYQSILLVDEKPTQVDSKTRKISALVKGLLQQADYLFLENPEKYLDDKTFKIFQKAIKYQLNERGQTLLLTTQNASLWQTVMTKSIITHKCQKTGRIQHEVKDKVYVPFKDKLSQLGSKKEEGVLIFNHPQSDKKAS